MARAAILYENMADAGSISASASVADMGVSKLISSPHVWDDQWRSQDNSPYVLLDLLADRTFDSVSLHGILNLGASATARLRVTTAAAGAISAETGDALDTGTLAAGGANLSAEYGAFVYLAAAQLTGRYVLLDLDDPDADYIQAGKIVTGLREALTYNFAPGSSFGWTDPSLTRPTRGGQTMVWERRAFRRAQLQFDLVTNAQRWGLVESLGRVVGVRAAVLLCLDPEADDLPAWTVWGMIDDQTPPAWTSAPDIYGKTIVVRERL